MKLKALELYASTEMSFKEIANKLEIKKLSPISIWKQVYAEEGIAGLKKTRWI